MKFDCICIHVNMNFLVYIQIRKDYVNGNSLNKITRLNKESLNNNKCCMHHCNLTNLNNIETGSSNIKKIKTKQQKVIAV